MWAGNLENPAVTTGLEKISFHSNLKEGQCHRMFKLLYNCAHLACSYVSKVILKILQVRLHQYMNWKLAYVQAGFRKGKGTRDQIANIHWNLEKEGNPRKTSSFPSLTTRNPLCGSQQTGKFLKRYQITFMCLLRDLCGGLEATEPYMEQLTGSQLGKEYNKAVYCHPVYLSSMQSTSWETLGWKKHKLESRLLGEISIT